MRIGLLGGSFNPVHLGHLALARSAYQQLDLDEVWFLPAGNHPLKDGYLLNLKQRVYLLKHALIGQNRFRISLFDAVIEKPSYSDELMKRLYREYPDHEFFFLVGADIIPELHKWHNYQWLIENVEICVFTRKGDFPQHRLKPREFGKLTLLEMPPVNISASEVRERIKKGENIAGMVPEINVNKTVEMFRELMT